MERNTIQRILTETAYVRTGGSPEELRCALYLQSECKKLGFETTLEPFTVAMSNITAASLTVDGKEIPCKGYSCAGSGTVEAPIYYLRDNSPYSLQQCKGKIVMFDGYLGYWKYQDLVEAGAAGYITCNGNLYFADRDIDQKEQRAFVHKGNRMPAVNIHAADAIEIVRRQGKTARIHLKQKQWQGQWASTGHQSLTRVAGEGRHTPTHQVRARVIRRLPT